MDGRGTEPHEDDERDLLDLVGPALSRLRRRTSAPRGDLTRNLVLNVVHERDGEMTVGDVGTEMGIAQPVASRAVAACVADGLLRRTASQSDGRRIVVALTEAGEVERRHLAAEQREGFELITAAWSPADRVRFAQYLVRYSQDSTDWSTRQRRADTGARSRRPRRPDVTTVEVVGGRETRHLELHDADERWPDLYLEHRRRIADALASVEVEIEHIGSTSVPGLAAKPIIDVVVAVDDITAEEDYLDALQAAGYRLRVREPGHRLVRTPERDVHVHLYQRDHPAVAEYLLLRDHLRTDADDRALYEDTKRRLLLRSWDSMDDYADAKSDVIAEIKARARLRRRDDEPGTA